MTFNPNQTRIWDRDTPADGIILNAEVLRIYENLGFLYDFATAQLGMQKGTALGRLSNTSSSPTVIKALRNNVYEVDGNMIRLSGELSIDFSSLSNIYRNDGTTAITATSETQNKHLYLLMTSAGALHAMIVPDAEMEGASHSYANNPELLKDYYAVSPAIYIPTKNGYYKNGKRILAVTRLNASNQVEFLYELGYGHRFMDVQNLPIGGKWTEFRWKREHPACYYPDGSTVTDMSTSAPELFRILSGNVLPDWKNRFPRNMELAGSRNIRDTEEDAFQGFKITSTYTPFSLYSGSGLTSGAGSYDVNVTVMNNIISDGINGVPRIADETRPKNYAELIQIVRG